MCIHSLFGKLIKDVFKKAKRNYNRNICVIVLCYRFGVRLSELASLKLGDVFEGDEPKSVLNVGKGSRNRIIRIDDDFIQGKHKECRVEIMKSIGGSIISGIPLFQSQKGSHSAKYLRRMVNINLKEAGIIGKTSKSLINGFAINLYSNGTDIAEIAKQIGLKKLSDLKVILVRY